MIINISQLQKIVLMISCLSFWSSYSQELSISDKMCDCLNKEYISIAKDELVLHCYNKSVDSTDYINLIRNHEEISDSLITDFAFKVTSELFRNCDFATEYLLDKYDEKPNLKNIECNEHLIGEFYSTETESPSDTVFYIFKKNHCIEKRRNGKYQSSSKINWINSCEYILTIEQTNDSAILNFTKELNNNTMVIVDITNSYIEIQSTFRGYVFQNKIFKYPPKE